MNKNKVFEINMYCYSENRLKLKKSGRLTF